MECPICMDPFTSSLRKEISCPSCSKSCCLKCIQTYFLQSANDPHCPDCMKTWNRSFIQEFLPKSFIDKDFAKRRADILWSREESFIPAAQEKALRIKKAEEYENEHVTPLKELIHQLYEKKREIENHLYKLQDKMYNEKNTVQLINEGRINLDSDESSSSAAGSSSSETIEKKKFHRKCTVENCPGWLSSNWKCGLCETYTCHHCLVIKGKIKDDSYTTHECKKEDVETANMLKASVKLCPKCGEGVEKNGGCNTMFCTACHTGFDWTTGKILQSGQIHNPHYFEWLARNGTGENVNNGDPCNNRIHPRMINHVGVAHRHAFGQMLRMIMHVGDVEFRRFEYHLTHRDNEDLLVEYLLKKKDKDSVKSSIQNRERRMEREKAIRDVLETFVMVGSERIRSVVGNPSSVIEVMEDLEKLRAFINESLRNVGKLYRCKIPYFEDWIDVKSIDVFSTKDKISVRSVDTLSHTQDEESEIQE
jgi:hypothetical protein